MLRAIFSIVLGIVATSCTRPRPAESNGRDTSPASRDGAHRLEPMSKFVFDEDFVGPFTSWKNVHEFGAVGDGVHDDTAAIQRALDELRTISTNDWSVLYFPRGRYRITSTLATRRETHQDYLGGSIVGEDPQATVIAWDGPAGQDMLHYDAWYTKLSRLTFDGATRARVGVYRGDSFSTYNELSDLVLQDLEIGIQLGGGLAHGQHSGQAEHAIVRSTFRRCSKMGVLSSDWNSLDNWVVFSRFEDCGFGLYNATGNFHAWRNVFLRSVSADISSANLGQFSFVDNTSVGSRSFVDWTRAHAWGAQVLVQGNRIYDATGGAISTGTAGPFIVLDNVIRNREGDSRPSILLASRDQIVMGNRQTGGAGDGVEVQAASANGLMRVHRFGNLGIGRATVEPPDLALPPTPPSRRRKVFELPRGAALTANALQKLIDAAGKEPLGTRPVVHIPKGLHFIDHTVTLPPGRDIQLVGDGASDAGSRLNWAGQRPGLMLALRGPSRAVLRDFSIYGNCDGVVIGAADQVGGRVFTDQLNVSGGGGPERGPRYGLYVHGVDDSDVTLTCGNVSGTWTNVTVRGGGKRASGKHAAGQTSMLMGSTSSAGLLYDVQDGGELLVSSVWYEGGWTSPTHINLSSSGALTLAMSQLSSVPDPNSPLIRLNHYHGTFSLIGSQMVPTGAGHSSVHRVQINGAAADTRIFFLGNSFMNSSGKVAALRAIWTDDSVRPASTTFIQNDQWGSFPGLFNALPDLVDRTAQSSRDSQAVRDGLHMLRSVRFQPPHARERGVTDVRVHRVQIQAGPGRTGFALWH